MIPRSLVALSLCCLASTAQAQGKLVELERRHDAAAQAHHDTVVHIARLRMDVSTLSAEFARRSARVAELRRAGRGLLVREALIGARSELQRVADPLARARTELRLAVGNEAVGRLTLILARSDLATKLLALGARKTQRAFVDESGRTHTLDQQNRTRLDRAQLLLSQLALLKRLEDPEPIPFDAAFSEATPDSELRNLANDCLLLADAARDHAADLAPVLLRRTRLVAQLRLSARAVPELTQALARERAALDRTQTLVSDLNKRARRYDDEAGRALVEVTCRDLRRIQEALGRRG